MESSSAERRTNALKKRLDALHFTEPLQTESAPLVEHILNELIRTTDGFRHLKQSYEQLRKQLSPTEAEVEDPASSSHKHSIDRSFKTDEFDLKASRRYDPSFDRIVAENQRLQRENTHYKTQVEKMMVDIQLQQDSERALQTQLFTLKQDVDSRTVRRTAAPEDPYALMTKISAMDAQKRINENEIANLKFELERTNRLKTALDGQIQFLKSELLRVKSDLEAETNARLKLLSSHEASLRECDLLRQENGTMKSQIELQRSELLEFDRKQQDYRVQLTSSVDRIRALERDYQTLSQTHAQTLSQNARAEQLNSSLMRDTRELKTYEVRFAESQREVISLQTELSEKEREIAGNKQELAGLEQSLRVKEQDLVEVRTSLTSLERQMMVVTQEKELYQQRSESLGNRTGMLESELKAMETEQQRRQQEIMGLEEKAGIQQRRLDQLERSLEKAEQDAKHYRGLCLQLTDSEKMTRDKLRSAEQHLHDLANQSMDDKNQLEKTHGVLQRQQRLYEEGQDQVFKLAQQNQQLEALVADLEAVRNDLSLRLDQVSEARRQAEINAQRLENELKSARDQLGLREMDLRQTKETATRDSMEVTYLQKRLEEQNETNQRLALALRNKESELSLVSERIQTLQRQNEELKGSKVTEVERLQDSIVRLQDQLYRVEQDRDRLKETYETVSRSEVVSQQLLKTTELEKEGLMLNCKKALEENERLSQSIGYSRAEQQEMYSKLQGFEQRFREQEDLIARYRAHIQRLESDLATRRPGVTEEKLTRSGSNKDLAAVYTDLEAERLKIERLESLLDEQKRVNADLRSDLATVQDAKVTLKKDADPRDQILSLEMEVMRLRDELGKAKHSQFRSDSKLRDLERRTNSLRAEP